MNFHPLSGIIQMHCRLLEVCLLPHNFQTFQIPPIIRSTISSSRPSVVVPTDRWCHLPGEEISPARKEVPDPESEVFGLFKELAPFEVDFLNIYFGYWTELTININTKIDLPIDFVQNGYKFKNKWCREPDSNRHAIARTRF